MVWLKHVRHRTVWLAAVLLLLALGFRLFVALRLPNDTPGDGVVYAQIARNVLEQHVYSHEEQPPFAPSLIRLPGYPFFLAAIYAVTGHGNNTAVRVVEAIIDTGTCVLVALVAFQWTEDKKRKGIAAIAALTLAAVCPFTTIYVATILTEVPTSFLAVLLCLVSTLAFKAPDLRRAIPLWIAAGLIAGLAVFFRPDSGLFAAAVGFTILLSALAITRDRKNVIQRFWKSIIVAAVFSFAFGPGAMDNSQPSSVWCLSAVITGPWRNARGVCSAWLLDVVTNLARRRTIYWSGSLATRYNSHSYECVS